MYLNEYHNLKFLYYINIKYPNIFKLGISKILDRDFIFGVVYNNEFLNSYQFNELSIIYKIYLNLNNGIYNEKALILSFSIYDKLNNIVDWKYLKRDFSNILKKYYSLKYHNKDLLFDLNSEIDKINNNDDIIDLKEYLIKLFLLREEYFKYCDFNIFNKINIDYNDDNYEIICLIKSLFSNNLEEIKKRSINLLKDNNLYIKIIKLSLSIPKYYEIEINENLLKIDNNEKIYTLDGEKFNLLIHVLNAYGSGGNYLDMNNKKGSRQICLSSITDFSMGFADFSLRPNSANIILGFNHIEPNTLLSISNYDSGSKYDGYHYDNGSMYFTDIRTNTLLTCYYNEYSIKRTDKLKPDYIVCFNKISNESLKAAKTLSIPIVLINEKKYIAKTKKNLNDLYIKAINGDINSISIYLFKMIQYYYTFGYRNNMADESINIINSLKDIVRNIKDAKKDSLLELLFSLNDFIISSKLSDKAKELEIVKKL